MKGSTTTITQKIYFNALPEEVYDVLLDPIKHSEFTGSKATGKPEVGAEFTAWEGYISGKNLELEKGKRILQEWSTSEWPKGYSTSRLELTFKEFDGKTELTMVHSNIPTVQEGELRKGWIEYYWIPLKSYFEKREIKNWGKKVDN